MPPRPQASGSKPGEPLVAVLLTWVLPGAGHVYLGRMRVALLAFALVEGLYLVGLKLSDGQAFEFLQADLRTALAPVLTPEAGNLGALLWHRRQHPFLPPGVVLPWPDTIKLGAWLTALGGVLNAVLMCAAHVDARFPRAGKDPRRHPAFHVLLAWLVPGLAHWMQGRRRRGATIFVVLVGLFLVGTFLGHGSNLDRERHFYYWGGQILLGLPAFLAELVHGHAPVTGEIPYADAALVFGSVAGLLNVLAMLDAYGRAERALEEPQSEARDARTAEARA
jgi:hypothetical protein